MEAGHALAREAGWGHRHRSDDGFTVARLLLGIIVVATAVAIIVPNLLVRGERAADGDARDRAIAALSVERSVYAADDLYGDHARLAEFGVSASALDGADLAPGKVYVRVTDGGGGAELVAPSDSGRCYWVKATPVRSWFAEQPCARGSASPGDAYRLAW